VIAEFVSNDRKRIDERKAEISAEEWDRCERMGHDYLRQFPDRWRDGSPLQSAVPAQDAGDISP
jgi:hypothetical protein